jgi:hypothetical protein
MNLGIQKEFVKIAFEMSKRSLPKKEDVFSYKSIADNMWRDKWNKAKDHFNIRFDWENNDSIGQKRVITFTYNSDEDISIEYKFNCDLWSAGGDWEYPCYYFKCQIVDGLTSTYNDNDLPFPGAIGQYDDSAHFILIPPKDQGNPRLVKADEDGWCAPHNGDVKDEDVPELNPRTAWQWLENYLKVYINTYFTNKNNYKNDASSSDPQQGQTKSAADNQYKPDFFSKTWYCNPTDEQLKDINTYNFPAKNIINGFHYSLVGRGFMNNDTKVKIINGITRLCTMYPENNEYKKALEIEQR